MFPKSFYQVTVLTASLGATAVAGCTNGSSADACHDMKKVLIGGGPTGMVGAADFDGTSFDIVANNTVAGTSASWLLFKEPDLLYAVDENSNNTRLYKLDQDTDNLTLVQNATGSSGVVFLGFNEDKTVMVGAAYGEGQIDIWDVSAEDGTLKLLKQIPAGGTPGPVTGRQDSPHPHEALLDPTGRFFVINDLGTDSILVLDSQDDFNVSNRINVTAGNGPRHGSFFPLGSKDQATHYFLACEITSLLKAFELTYTGDGLEFTEIQSLSTFGAAFPPANATTASAGELVISSDNKHLYVSNRLTGNATDSISHFSIQVDADEPLIFVDQISSGGLLPRMFSLAKDNSVLFSTNQNGESGLLAFTRDAKTGSLTETPVASVALDKFGPPGMGPQFVMELGATKGSNST